MIYIDIDIDLSFLDNKVDQMFSVEIPPASSSLAQLIARLMGNTCVP